jgi:hypothetical protein
VKPELARPVRERFTDPADAVDSLMRQLRYFYEVVWEHPNEAFRQEAIKAFYDFTTEAVVLMRILPEAELARVARNEYLLPVLASPHSDSSKEIKELVERLELGRSALINMRAKGTKGRARFSFKTPVHLWTWVYLHRLLYFRKRLDTRADPVTSAVPWLDAKEPPGRLLRRIRSLPPFGVASRDSWADLAWKLLFFDHDGHPEKSELLRRLGSDKAGRGRGKKGSKTYECDIRDGIKRSFKLAFSRLPPRS